MDFGPSPSIVGALEAARDAGRADALCDALHPALRTWVYNGGEDPLWGDAVSRLRGGGSVVPGDLSRLHFDDAVDVLGEQSVETCVAWVCNVSDANRSQAFYYVTNQWAPTSPDAYLELVAEALDGDLSGIMPVACASIVGRSIPPTKLCDLFLKRRQSVIDLVCVRMLDDRDDLHLATDLLYALQDARVELSPGARSIMAGDRVVPSAWLLLLAAGNSPSVEWQAEWGYKELAYASLYARDGRDIAHFAQRAQQHLRRRVMFVERGGPLRGVGATDKQLVHDAMVRLDEMQLSGVRDIMCSVVHPLLVRHLSLCTDEARLSDAELSRWAMNCEEQRTAHNQLSSIAESRGSERMTAALLRECRGIAENALFHGSEDVGYAVGAVLALQIETKSQWALLLAMADNFEGTITELCHAVLALDEDQA